jgi:ribosomal protein L11 methyltransferase
MVRDASRVGAFEKAIKKVVKKGDKVLELGCGSGILSIIAASCGATVVAVEADRHIALLAKKNFDKYSDLDITLIETDAVKFINSDEAQKFDVIIAELMSIWCLEEPQTQTAS